MTTEITTLDLIETSGLGIYVENKSLGTGNGSTDSYSLANGNVVSGSYSLEYGDVDSNDLTALTETTDYTIDKNSGDILLKASGISAINGKVLYATYIYSPKANDEVLQSWADEGWNEMELFTGNYWGAPKDSTEIQDGRESPRYPTTDEPYARDYDEEDEIQLKYKQVNTVDEIKFVKGSQDLLTLTSDQYSFDSNGRIVLLNVTLPVGKRSVSITYNHGYDPIDPNAKKLATLFSAIIAFANVTGGSYDDVTSFTLGRKQISIGEVYVNVDQAVKQFNDQKNVLLRKLGDDMFCI